MKNSIQFFISSVFDFKTAYLENINNFKNANLVDEDGYSIDKNSSFQNITIEPDTIKICNTIFLADEKHRVCPYHEIDKICFINCIFQKRLSFYKQAKSLYFDNCIFLENFAFGSYDWKINLDFTCCSINTFYLFEATFREISVSSSSINFMEIHNIDSKIISISSSDINHLSFCENQYKTLRFNPHQLIKANPGTTGFSKQLEKSILYKHKGPKIPFFYFPYNNSNIKQTIRYSWKSLKNSYTMLKSYLLELVDIQNGRIDDVSYWTTLEKLNTLEFLQNETYYRFYPSTIRAFETLTNKLLYRKRLIKPFIILLDKLMYAKYNVGLMIFTILAYALIYHNFGIFNVSKNNDVQLGFSDSFYFSAITFFTIGYGDITPVNATRLISASEGFFGIMLSGLFVVILARKFLGK